MRFTKHLRWVSYTQQNIPGNQSFDLRFHHNLREAKDFFHAYCVDVGYDDCSMTLYSLPGDPRDRTEMIEQAKEFEDYGCPFDYPDRIIERGPLGGIKIEGC